MNITPLEKKALEAFKDAVRKAFGKKIILLKIFGSRARGEGDEDSDMDVLVLLQEVSLQDKHRIWDMANDIFLEMEVDISPLVMSEARFKKLQSLERLLAKEIEQDGVPL